MTEMAYKKVDKTPKNNNFDDPLAFGHLPHHLNFTIKIKIYSTKGPGDS